MDSILLSPAPVGGAPQWQPRDKASLVGMTGFILLINTIGWGVLVLAVAPQNYVLGSAGVFGVGLGLNAFLLGVRHAFDADHIAAIDNATRKLVGEGQPAQGVGFCFALGHSSVVLGLSLLMALGLHALADEVQDENSPLRHLLKLIGTGAAVLFLIGIGVLNLIAVIGIAKVFRRMRAGKFDEAELERQLNNRGLLARRLDRWGVSKSSDMYRIGVLMGLCCDTASQVALLLVLATGSAASGLPWYALIVLPVLFAAGMTIFDTADGVLMSRAYGWAFLKPTRRVFYNLTVTALSVLVALVTGGIMLIGLLDIESGPLAWVGSLNLTYAGFMIVGLFVITWLLALAIWRLGRIDVPAVGSAR